jgi:hypothetical protein
MPEGNEGNTVSGRFIPLLKLSQKHRGHSFSKLKLDGENL